MIIEHFNWCQENKGILYNGHTISREAKHKLYEIYNAVTGESKKPNGCGRCQTNVVKMVKFELEKQVKVNEN